MYTHTFFEKLSMKVTKYLAPPTDVVFMGPYTFKCTISKGLVVRLPLSFENVVLYYCHSMHASQFNKDVEHKIWPSFMSFTICEVHEQFSHPNACRQYQNSSAFYFFHNCRTLVVFTLNTLMRFIGYNPIYISLLQQLPYQKLSQYIHLS